MTNLNITKALKTIATKLPDRKIIRYDQTWISGKDLLLTGVKEYKGEKIDPKRSYMMQVPVYRMINQEHKLRLAWLANGLQGVYNYLEPWIGEERLKQVKQNFMRVS